MIKTFKVNPESVQGTSKDYDMVYYVDMDTGLVWWDYNCPESAMEKRCLVRNSIHSIKRKFEDGHWLEI